MFSRLLLLMNLGTLYVFDNISKACNYYLIIYLKLFFRRNNAPKKLFLTANLNRLAA